MKSYSLIGLNRLQKYPVKKYFSLTSKMHNKARHIRPFGAGPLHCVLRPGLAALACEAPRRMETVAEKVAKSHQATLNH
jgi:hypothetical protein